MPDVFTIEKRSSVMSLIRGRGNKDTELKLMARFKSEGFTGWRRSFKLFGKPDFVFPKLKVAVFVDGCFWHGCPKHSNMPTNNREFWSRKLTANKTRDKLVNLTLRRKGWKVLRIWEHELTKKNATRLLSRLRHALEPQT